MMIIFFGFTFVVKVNSISIFRNMREIVKNFLVYYNDINFIMLLY